MQNCLSFTNSLGRKGLLHGWRRVCLDRDESIWVRIVLEKNRPAHEFHEYEHMNRCTQTCRSNV